MAHNRLSRKRFATLLLACMMLLSFCAFVFAACATSDEDEDGLPSMPPAQKIVIGVCLVLAVVVVVYVALSNAGMIG